MPLWRSTFRAHGAGQMLNIEFLAEFKHRTEAKWRDRSINPNIHGFQIQPGTRSNHGLTDDQITAFEDVLKVRFPQVFRVFLRGMNGTDLSTLNVYGYCGEPPRHGVSVYSYPREVELVRALVEAMLLDRDVLIATMAEQGFDLPPSPDLVPIDGHRYVLCTPDRDGSVVLAINGADDAIVYGNSLQEYRERAFLRDGT